MSSKKGFDEKDALAITALRMLAVDMVEKANSGHPGLPLGASPMAYVLWTRLMRHNPANPLWANRDRFVLSAGHGSAMLYSLLHLCGYGLTMDELKNFRQWGSRTPGHPERGLTPGVETTTGPLGQGIANAVGMAWAESLLAAQFNRPGFAVADHRTFAICGDGDLMEGVALEAISLAGHLKLGKLVMLYDDNHITIEGDTQLAFTEDVGAKFRACGWHVEEASDGNDPAVILAAVERAQASCGGKPCLVKVRTVIGYGSPVQGKASVHGEPLGKHMPQTRAFYKWPEETFHVPQEARAQFESAGREGAKFQGQWEELFKSYSEKYPQEAAEFRRQMSGELPKGWKDALPRFRPEDGQVATRDASGKVINALGEVLPGFLGGSADLAPSNKTAFAKHPERTLHFGIREHAMGAVVNGMALHGGLLPFGATFMAFSDYMRPAIRLAALSHIHSLFVFTHDGIGVGEDGPTHQPVEQLSALRVIPGLLVFRPADANEASAVWAAAVEKKRPACLMFTRQKLPVLGLPMEKIMEGAARGAYVVFESAGKKHEVAFLASGSEVSIAMDAAKALDAEGVGCRVVSMPSFELFNEQDQAYRDAVLPPSLKKRVAVEAASSMSWLRYVGEQGRCVCVDRFGASAPYQTIYEKYGLTAENVRRTAREILG
ncbi:MAG: transketolase [Elusimicrobia bacterium]|nr:transketolase [Elusimicrobiota bacterium]